MNWPDGVLPISKRPSHLKEGQYSGREYIKQSHSTMVRAPHNFRDQLCARQAKRQYQYLLSAAFTRRPWKSPIFKLEPPKFKALSRPSPRIGSFSRTSLNPSLLFLPCFYNSRFSALFIFRPCSNLGHDRSRDRQENDIDPSVMSFCPFNLSPSAPTFSPWNTRRQKLVLPHWPHVTRVVWPRLQAQ